MGAIFISYRREDSQFATDRIYEHLAKKFDRKSLFMDVDNVPYGVNFRSHIAEAVARSQVLLAVIGPAWLETRTATGQRRLDDPEDFVRIEIETALAKGVRVLPVLVGGATMPPRAQLPKSLAPLAEINAVPVRADPDFAQDLLKLRTALVGMVGAERAGPRIALMAAGAAAVGILIVALLAYVSLSNPSPGPVAVTPQKVQPSAPGSPTVTPSADQRGDGERCRDIPVTDMTKMPPVTTTRRFCD